VRDERLVRIGREIFLAALGLPLDSMDSWVIDRLTSILEECEVRAGQKLFTAGEPLEFLYFMQEGRVRFTRGDAPSWTLKGRWVLGGFEVLGDRPATHTATALEDVYGMRVSAVAWVEMLEDSSQLARSAVVNASRAVTQLEERVSMGDAVALDDRSLVSMVPPGTMTLVERLALLLDVRMLRLAGVQALADLAAVSEELSFAAGELVFERGVEHDHLVRIVEGEVLAERAGPAVVRRQGPGDLVCGTAILGHVAERWQARAVTPTRAISFSIEALFDLMEEHFDLVRSTLAALGARRELLLDRLAALTPDLELT
jgi:CRP-like cAMP-binding protein